MMLRTRVARSASTSFMMSMLGWALILAAGAFLTPVFMMLFLGPTPPLWAALVLGLAVAVAGGRLAFGVAEARLPSLDGGNDGMGPGALRGCR